ncbi:MAG: LytTR family transcriptional regulator [Lachnospiraceae bacterium]|nr:LytTR family transcriptional regulator [Lachnospiraceae bacterium]
MKVRIEVDENFIEEEVVIRCSALNAQIQAIQKAVTEITSGSQQLVFYKGETEYYLPLEEVLFFETDGGGINAHTATDVYQTKYKLYELEELLPGYFMRISKSGILNIRKIFSMTKSISTCVVEFQNTHKQVFVSRYYYKPLKEKMDEKRMSR